MIKFIFKNVFRLIKSILFLILFIITLLVFPYIGTTFYKFPEPVKFSGEKIYNPYAEMDSESWYKANFQIQSYAWKGLTDGRKNTNEVIDSLYTYLEYDVIATSDYMKINQFANDRDSYLSVYEHGYGIFKNHQICIGASKVNWKDFFFYQTLHHKQNILNHLSNYSNLVFVAHPKFRGGYSPEDFRYLSNYTGIEVLNGYRISLEYWDAALSSGHYATILSDDDAHDVSNPDELGHYCTFINTAVFNRENLIESLKMGNSFGAEIYRELGDSYEIKKEKLKQIATLNKVEVNGDTLLVEVDQLATEIRFVGQEGKLLATTLNDSIAKYVILAEDTYVRTEIFFPNGNNFYLNPVVRDNGSSLNMPKITQINFVNTWLFRMGAFIIFALLMITLFYTAKWVIK